MKLKLLAAAIVLVLFLATVPNVMADTIISDVTYQPLHPKQGDTIHVVAKVVATENITYARLLNCWEQPTYTCGFPKDMTDANKDSYYEADINNSAWTNGNTVHLTVSITVKSGAEKKYNITPIVIGAASGPGDYQTEADCKGGGYFWWDSACHEKAKQPSDYTNQTACEGAGLFWWDSKCNSQKGTPDKYADKDACTKMGYFWYDSKCNEQPKKVDGKKFIPTLEGGLVFTAIAIGGLALLGIRSRRKR